MTSTKRLINDINGKKTSINRIAEDPIISYSNESYSSLALLLRKIDLQS
jgi:hypothetical protein